MAVLLAQTFWACLVIGLAMSIAWRFVLPGRLRTNLQIVGSLLVFVPQLVIIFLLYQSISLLLYQEALLSLWMLGTAALLITQLWARLSRQTETPSSWRFANWRKTEKEIAFETQVYEGFRKKRQQRPTAVLVLTTVLLGGFGLYLARTFLLDAFYPRTIVAGRVDALRFNRGSRAPRLSDIFIAGHVYHATRDLHSRIQPGDYIHAEIGAGSHAVLHWQRYAADFASKRPSP
jgi:hypothetical protein